MFQGNDLMGLCARCSEQACSMLMVSSFKLPSVWLALSDTPHRRAVEVCLTLVW